MLFDESNDLLGLYVNFQWLVLVRVRSMNAEGQWNLFGRVVWHARHVYTLLYGSCRWRAKISVGSLFLKFNAVQREVRDFILLSCCLRKRFLIGRWGPLLWLSQIWNQPMKACLSQFCPLADVECWLLWLDARWVGCSKVYNMEMSHAGLRFGFGFACRKANLVRLVVL